LRRSYSTGARSEPGRKLGRRSSTGSRAGTTASAAIPGSATARRTSTNSTTKGVTARPGRTRRPSLNSKQRLPNVYVLTKPGAVQVGSSPLVFSARNAAQPRASSSLAQPLSSQTSSASPIPDEFNPACARQARPPRHIPLAWTAGSVRRSGHEGEARAAFPDCGRPLGPLPRPDGLSSASGDRAAHRARRRPPER
jgi:hypothetical protein